MIRWTVVVSDDTDKELRCVLAEQGNSKKGAISTFVEQAVRKELFRQTVREIKAENATVPLEEIEATIDAALNDFRKAKAAHVTYRS